MTVCLWIWLENCVNVAFSLSYFLLTPRSRSCANRHCQCGTAWLLDCMVFQGGNFWYDFSLLPWWFNLSHNQNLCNEMLQIVDCGSMMRQRFWHNFQSATMVFPTLHLLHWPPRTFIIHKVLSYQSRWKYDILATDWEVVGLFCE